MTSIPHCSCLIYKLQVNQLGQDVDMSSMEMVMGAAGLAAGAANGTKKFFPKKFGGIGT